MAWQQASNQPTASAWQHHQQRASASKIGMAAANISIASRVSIIGSSVTLALLAWRKSNAYSITQITLAAKEIAAAANAWRRRRWHKRSAARRRASAAYYLTLSAWHIGARVAAARRRSSSVMASTENNVNK